jgi:hypothetical protein
MSVAHRPTSVVYLAVIRQIIKTFPEAIVSRDRWKEDAKSMFDLTSRGGRQEGGSLVGGILEVDEEL